jgi:hypothetical protein
MGRLRLGVLDVNRMLVAIKVVTAGMILTTTSQVVAITLLLTLLVAMCLLPPLVVILGTTTMLLEAVAAADVAAEAGVGNVADVEGHQRLPNLSLFPTLECRRTPNLNPNLKPNHSLSPPSSVG